MESHRCAKLAAQVILIDLRTLPNPETQLCPMLLKTSVPTETKQVHSHSENFLIVIYKE